MTLNSLNYDRSVYYTIKDALNDAGIPASGINIIDGDLSDYLIEQSEAGVLNLETFDEATVLPAIAITDEDILYNPAALGGATFARRGYNISVYGTDPSFSKEMAEAITHKIKNRITVYDYTIATPDVSGFPLSGQLIGTFPVENIRNIRPRLPSLSLLDSVRRDIFFEIVPMEQ